MSEELQVVTDFEADIDSKIDKFFETKRVTVDQVEMQEKRFIIRELALASKQSEIVNKINEWRAEKGLPSLNDKFDLYYYKKEYAELIDAISLEYAQNIMKKYRFAGRIPRIGKLNELAEGVLDRIRARESRAAKLDLNLKEERAHLDNISLFSKLLAAIDEQMGKLKVTTIDVNLRTQSEKPIISNATDLEELIRKSLTKYSSQLPNSIDANFVDITDYQKCAFAEQWPGGRVYCKYFGEVCKVQTDEIKSCEHFVNRLVLENKEHLTNLYKEKNLSASTIAEIAGCKNVDPKVVDMVRGYLKKYELYGPQEKKGS